MCNEYQGKTTSDRGYIKNRISLSELVYLSVSIWYLNDNGLLEIGGIGSFWKLIGNLNDLGINWDNLSKGKFRKIH
jgi:hypothetical protein